MRSVIILLLAALCALSHLRAADLALLPPLTDPAELQIQVTYPQVGALGQPFLLQIGANAPHTREFLCDGEAVDAGGMLVLSGNWDLILDEIQGTRVITSVSLKPAPGAAAAPAPILLSNYAQSRTWNAKPQFTHVGNYQFHLKYGSKTFDGMPFRIDATLDAPPWIALTVTPDKQRAMLGEPVVVRVQVTNSGTDSYPVSFGGDYRGATRALRFFFTVERSDGSKGWDPEPLQSCMGGIGTSGGLAPGTSHHQDIVLGAYVRFPGPGTYRVRAYHALGFGTPVPGLPQPGGFGDFAHAGEFTIELDPPNADDSERIVRAGFSERDDHQRWQQLAYLHEPCFLAPLLKVLAEPGAEAGSTELVRGIASIPTLPATAALIDLLSDPRVAVQTATLQTLVWRMPRRDRWAGAQKSPEQLEEARVRAALVAQTWDEEQARRLRPMLATLLASTDKELCLATMDVLAEVGGPDEVELLARTADRLGATVAVLEQNPQLINWIQNAAYALGAAHLAPCRAETGSTPGRLVCWAYMQFGRGRPTEPATDALLLAMLDVHCTTVRHAALTAFSADAGARLPIPWQALFMDRESDIWRTACGLSEGAPPATIIAAIRACPRDGWDGEKRKYFAQALQYLAKREKANK